VNAQHAFLTGAISIACFVIALFFLRFWISTRDRFFVFFALSFALEGIVRGASAVLYLTDDNPAFYGARVIAYGLILVAIWQKNRR
jgi:uncharacterized membrane protein HdeD (DUF308 family)